MGRGARSQARVLPRSATRWLASVRRGWTTVVLTHHRGRELLALARAQRFWYANGANGANRIARRSSALRSFAVFQKKVVCFRRYGSLNAFGWIRSIRVIRVQELSKRPCPRNPTVAGLPSRRRARLAIAERTRGSTHACLLAPLPTMLVWAANVATSTPV